MTLSAYTSSVPSLPAGLDYPLCRATAVSVGGVLRSNLEPGGDAVQVDVGLGDGRAVGRPGDDVHLVPGAAERVGEAEHVRAHAAQTLLGRILVGDQPDSHSSYPPWDRRPRSDMMFARRAAAFFRLTMTPGTFPYVVAERRT